MDKRTYFLTAMRAGCYQYKQWVIEAFALTQNVDQKPREYPLALIRTAGVGYSFIGENGQIVLIDNASPDEPLFAFQEDVNLYPGDLANATTALITCYGNLLFNQIVLCHIFGDRFPYRNSNFSINKLLGEIGARMHDDPAPGEKLDPKYISVQEYCRFSEAVQFLTGFNNLCVVSATPKMLTADPQIRVRRDELLKKYEGQLHDPVIQAKIEDELKAIDRAWMVGDAGERFYRAKSYNVVRKKKFIMQGATEGFGETGSFIPTSLDDGWDKKYLPDMNNQLRDGSYSRGAQTALAGEVVKFNNRIFQNTSIIEDDCGSTLGWETTLVAETAKRYLSSSIIVGDKLVELTEQNLDKYIGKKVVMRYPTYCKSTGANFCATCAGKNVSTVPNAISTYVSNIGSLFMNLFMKAMHGKTLKVVDANYLEDLS